VVFPSRNENSTSNKSEFKIVDGMEDEVMILKRTNNESKNDNWLPWLMKRANSVDQKPKTISKTVWSQL